jgi:ketol-acid reductoisomerase
MNEELIKIEYELIQESGLDPQVWIDLYAKDYRELVEAIVQAGETLDK